MNPLRIRAANLKTYPALDVELPVGCIGVVGANGAGKSTVVNAIDVALFGPEGRSLEPYLSDDAAPGDTLLLELELDHGGERYRIRRTFTSGGRGRTTLDFALVDLGGTRTYEPLTQGTVADTQALIERTIGLTRETFRASAMLAQGDGDGFTSAQPRDRKRILADVLGLGIWDDAKTLVNADVRAQKTELDKVTGSIEALEQHLAADTVMPAAIQAEEAREAVRLANLAEMDASERAQQARTRHEQLAERASKAAQARAALQAAQAEHASLAREQERATRALAELAGAEQKLPELRARAAELTENEAERERLYAEKHAAQLRAQERASVSSELEEVVQSRQRSLAAAESAQAKLDGVLRRIATLTAKAPARCHVCEQDLPDDARGLALASSQREADDGQASVERHTNDARELEQRAERLNAKLATIEPVLIDERPLERVLARGRELAHAREDLAAALERIEGHRQTGSLRESFADELAAAERKVSEVSAEVEAIDAPTAEQVEASRAAAQEAERAVPAARSLAEETRHRLAQATARLELIEQAAREHAEATAERDRLQADLDELLLLERAFGRDGVPTWILETSAIPALEVEADRLLTLLGTDYRVELRTEREKKSGGTSETLDVVLLTPTGERDYGSFSGGERTRLNLALRLALARLLAHRKGAESRLLCIDEPEFLDQAGTERLIEALQEMHGSGEFDRILLVSHVPALRDAFDTTIRVEKRDGRSEALVA